MTTDNVIVTTTTDSVEEARSLTDAAVAARLAACAHIHQVESVYWWDGEVQKSAEWEISFKTPAPRADGLSAYILEHHSYDTPQVIVTPIVGGSDDYLAWLDKETRPR